MKPFLYFFLLVLLSGTATAQQDSTAPAHVQFKLGVHYTSSLHYYGRTDSLRSSGMYPLAELWLGKNWYVNAAPVFVHNAVAGTDYAGTVTTLGYLSVSDKWITHLYALKPFYQHESQLVQSALKAQAGSSVTLLSKVANLTIGGDIKYSNQVDFGAQASLDHPVRTVVGGNVLVISPAVALSAGTQRFLQTYREKKGLLFPREEVVTKESQAFRILAWEASVPFVYSVGRLQFIATPAYVQPCNLQAGESGKPLAYITLGAKYGF